MPRPRSGERIRGPYEDKARQRWRVESFAADGTVSRTYHPSEAIALKYVEILEASVVQIERDTESAAAAYMKFLRQSGASKNHLERTAWALGEFFPEPIALASLTIARCKGLYNALRTRPRRVQVKGKGWVRPEEGPPLSPDSHRGALKQARSFLTWCVEQGWLRENPALAVKPVGKLRPRGKSLGKHGVKYRIRDARQWYTTALEMADASDVGAVAALVACLCGLRASEIARRPVGDLDTDEVDGDVLHVTDRKNDEDIANEVPDVLRPYLLRLAEGKARDEYLFQNAKGRPRSRHWVLAQVHRVCDRAGLPRHTTHGLRGLMATLAFERGTAGHIIAATLGHDEKITRTAYAEPGAAERGERRAGLKVLKGGRR